ncbi:response regulator [Paracoccus sp. TK19116]|uniref:Response regulator n=1 Tax=Paracoccus albicereus TaxID=2922394 RepID=A0ABT1MQQ6_9RHOB|nr:response regulator [Paracoccus albicereus]MCQ0970464.1 response regulator [Paracoccus albicereus]
MTEPSLTGRSVLVVENEYLIAVALQLALEERGATVVGPAPSVESALNLIDDHPELDAAILDINLDGTTAFPVADRLCEKRCRLVFMTGYDAVAIPARFQSHTRLEKPVDAAAVAGLIATEIAS